MKQQRKSVSWVIALMLVLSGGAALACEGHTAEATAQAVKAQAQVETLEASNIKCGSCSGPENCSCKKGKCECPACKKHHNRPMMDSLKGKSGALRLPAKVRRDATAGAFI